MNTLSRLGSWSPVATGRLDLLQELESIEQRIESLLGRAGPLSERFFAPPYAPQPSLWESRTWFPAVDISETAQEYVLKADLPQLAKADLKVSARQGVLEISGQRHSQKEEQGQQVYRLERAYGAFQRSFTLPPEADATKAKATLSEGVLTVRIPKSGKTAAQSTEIKIG